MGWWRSIEWGTLPEGVGSLLTATSVMLAVLIYRRDRRQAERAQVSQVSTWLTGPRDEPSNDRHVLVLHLINHSDRLIFDPTLVYEGSDRSETPIITYFATKSNSRRLLVKDAHVHFEAAYKAFPARPYNLRLYVRDSGGITWCRDPQKRNQSWEKAKAISDDDEVINAGHDASFDDEAGSGQH